MLDELANGSKIIYIGLIVLIIIIRRNTEVYFLINLPTSASNIINHLMVSQVLGLQLLFESE